MLGPECHDLSVCGHKGGIYRRQVRVAKAISLLRTVDRLAPVLRSRMEGQRYVAGSRAGMLQISSLLSATHAARRSSEKFTRGIAAPADDQRRQRHWRLMPTVNVPAPQPKPGCGSVHFGERRWALGALAHDHEAGPLRALREAASSSCRNSRRCPRSWAWSRVAVRNVGEATSSATGSSQKRPGEWSCVIAGNQCARRASTARRRSQACAISSLARGRRHGVTRLKR